MAAGTASVIGSTWRVARTAPQAATRTAAAAHPSAAFVRSPTTGPIVPNRSGSGAGQPARPVAHAGGVERALDGAVAVVAGGVAGAARGVVAERHGALAGRRRERHEAAQRARPLVVLRRRRESLGVHAATAGQDALQRARERLRIALGNGRAEVLGGDPV